MPGMTEGSLPLQPRGVMPNSIELVEHVEEERRRGSHLFYTYSNWACIAAYEHAFSALIMIRALCVLVCTGAPTLLRGLHARLPPPDPLMGGRRSHRWK